MAHAGWTWNLIATLKINYFADMPLINFELFGEVCLILSTLVLLAYVIYLSIRKFHWHSAFFNRVSHILFLCTFKKVIWITAWWIIATMKHFKCFWISVLKSKRHTVSEECFTETLNLTISTLGLAEFPHPTLFNSGNSYTIPESNLKCRSVFPTFYRSALSPHDSLFTSFHVLIVGGVQ